jgi:hypothetical protein
MQNILLKINKQLHEKGMAKDISLVYEKSYFRFVGGNTPLWYDTFVSYGSIEDISKIPIEKLYREYLDKENKFKNRNETEETKRMKQVSKNIWIIEKVYSTEMQNYLLESLSEVERLVKILKEYDITFCLLGGKALPFYGYRRFTEDVDILVAEKDKGKLAKIPSGVMSDHSRVQPFRVWLMSNFPDKGKTKVDMLFSKDDAGKGIKFDDPKKVSHEINGIPVINLYDLIRYKISSGLSGTREEDLKDVKELIKANNLDITFMDKSKEQIIKKEYNRLWKVVKKQKESFDKYFEI